MEISENLRDKFSPILEQQDQIQKIVNAASVPALDTIKDVADNDTMKALQKSTATVSTIMENSRTIQAMASAGSALQALQTNSMIHTIGELAIKSAIQNYQFESPVLKMIEAWNDSVVTNLASG